MKCAEKVAYASEMLARNAAWLHGAAHPECDGVTPYEHDDHWHIGHATWWASRRCVDDDCPPIRRPRRGPARRRYPSRKLKAVGR